jgi:hypothetical protein
VLSANAARRKGLPPKEGPVPELRSAPSGALVVLCPATPRGLAEFARQGKEQERLVERLLADARLMLQMVVADGADEGKFGQAMKIYTDIPPKKPPPLDDDLAIKPAQVVPMLSSEWQAKLDLEDASQNPDEQLFRWDGKFTAHPKVEGEWKLVGQVE